jgi:hypothetical protein
MAGQWKRLRRYLTIYSNVPNESQLISTPAKEVTALKAKDKVKVILRPTVSRQSVSVSGIHLRPAIN